MMNNVSKPEEKMSPKEWLQHIRELKGLNKNFCIPKDSLKEFINRIPEKFRKNAEKIWFARYNVNISDIHDELMETYLQQIKPILTKDELEIIKNTYFGIFPTCDFNGFAGYTPKGDRIVLLHEGLGYTINFWSHWYLRLLDENGIDYLLKNPTSLEYVLSYILSIWYGKQNYKTPLPDIYPKTEDSWSLSERLTLSSIAFVLGHEIGHIYYGHNKYSNNKNHNHKMEFEADLVSLRISIRFSLIKSTLIYSDTYYTKYMLFGPLFALGIMSLFGDSDSLTHPSPSSRRDNIINNIMNEIRTLVGDEKFDVFLEEMDIDLHDILKRNSDRLFEKFKDYREIINLMDEFKTPVDNTWLKMELEKNSKKYSKTKN